MTKTRVEVSVFLYQFTFTIILQSNTNTNRKGKICTKAAQHVDVLKTMLTKTTTIIISYGDGCDQLHQDCFLVQALFDIERINLKCYRDKFSDHYISVCIIICSFNSCGDDTGDLCRSFFCYIDVVSNTLFF